MLKIINGILSKMHDVAILSAVLAMIIPLFVDMPETKAWAPLSSPMFQYVIPSLVIVTALLLRSNKK
ncbi:hypothetical protein LRP52_37065 [Photobacterium sp. ZSDE20]|uniref:Uncharacterized protein n=1 Tax=Photobacterium pectinilyticum TaxID=2906793 RepID=A0ABT1N780_9GAMM|nr:hypothetical protein [Photobacterium sp. ZSDE20]MCQ1060603.1 hypothetical protein [Photobacterium sp. ZSDE20]MDD1827798.1 hypothetical protein [Photobacterium sp. ZSDE20]